MRNMYKKIVVTVALIASNMAILPVYAQTSNFMNMAKDFLRSKSTAPKDVYEDAKNNNKATDETPKICQQESDKYANSGNPIVDIRCKLVAFEVCMHQKAGIISQSQGSAKQCEIMKGLAGKNACQIPCEQAALLPKGGNYEVTTHNPHNPAEIHIYSGLTKFSHTCFEKTLAERGGFDNYCARNDALQCLINASASKETNAAILVERKQACSDLKSRAPQISCTACIDGKPRIDYDPAIIDLDPEHCTPELAKKGHCKLP